jgi:hypothetical protein
MLLPRTTTDVAFDPAGALGVLVHPLRPLKLPLVDVVVTVSPAGGMLSLAAATKAFSRNGPRNMLIGTCSRSYKKVCN